MPQSSSQPEMIGLRILVSVATGIASVAAIHLTGLLALAALDGGGEPALVAYSLPVALSFLTPVLAVQFGLCPRGRWRGIIAGLGGAMGTTSGILAAASLTQPVAWLFAFTVLGTLVGSLVWLPWPGVPRARASEGR
jgi:hypothetical protein